MKKIIFIILILCPLHALYSQLPVDKWTGITIDTARQTWGEGKFEWVRGFGVDAFDVDHDGFKDIVAGWYFYRNPGGNMTGEWKRTELIPKADGVLFTNVNDDDIADIIAVAGQDVYWFEVPASNSDKMIFHKVGKITETDHLNGQGYLMADVIKGGKPEVLLMGGEGLYMAEIPDNPEKVQWNFILIAETSSSEGFDAVDIDGDGDLDIVCGKPVGDEPDGPRELYCFENPGIKSEKWANWKLGTTKYPIDRVKAADLDKDGIPEIVVTEERWNVIKPVANLWVFSASSKMNRKSEWNGKILASHYSLNNLDLGDINNDGNIDIVTSEHKGPDLKTFIYLNDGLGNFSEREIFKGAEMHLGAKFTDLDNDGDLDIIGPAWDRYNIFTILRNDAIKIRQSDSHEE